MTIAKSTTARVIFSTPTMLDIRDAMTYGEHVTLLDKADYSIHKADWVIDVYRTKLDAIGYNPEVDYIAFTGHTVFVSLLALVASDYGNPKYLLFDQLTRRYEPNQYMRDTEE